MPSEEKMANPHPTATAAEVEQWQSETDPATGAARNIMVRRMDGLYRRSYLNGSSDHAPVLQGVRDLTEACFAVLINAPTEIHGPFAEAMANMQAILEDHGCKN